MFKPTFKNPNQAFNEAIAAGRLTENKKDSNFAGNYMYMYTDKGKDAFKNIITRGYLK